MLVINEVATGTYVMPLIDNRRRKGYKMWATVMETTEYRTAILVKLDGSTVGIVFDGGGWREVAATRITADTYTVPSASQPGELHVVRLVRGGWQCDCTASFYNKGCKHVALVAAIVNDENRWEKARKAASIEDARRVVLNRMLGRPDDYLMHAD